MQSDMDDKINSTVHNFRLEMDDLETKKDQELASLRRTIDKLHRDKEDSSLRFEEEKHKSLMLGKK